jgi:iron complex transport system substrate-binding protein
MSSKLAASRRSLVSSLDAIAFSLPSRNIVLAVFALGLALVGCRSTPEVQRASVATPTVLAPASDAAGGAPDSSTATPPRPRRIVSLSPVATEVLFAIGAGDQVVAVDDQSNYPPEAPTTDLSGFQPNIEAIAGYDPELVVISNDMAGLRSSLEKLGIPVLLQEAPQDFEGTFRQIEEMGEVTRHPDAASALVRDMRREIGDLTARAGPAERGRTYYHELDDTYYTVTSDTFVGQVYALAGLDNIADTVSGGSDYPQLSAEYILDADPDFIFLADTVCCGQSAATLATRPGWSSLTAVQEGRVVALNDDVASRWGPRVVDFLAAVVYAVAPPIGSNVNPLALSLGVTAGR